MKKLYRFYTDYGRMGDVEGYFVEEEQNVLNSIGKEVYFGEILGKHSEVGGILEEEDLSIIECSQEFIEEFERVVGNTGYNPLLYLSEESQEL